MTTNPKTTERPRRPAVAKRAEQLKAQHPDWTANECAAQAKAEYFAKQKAAA